jgi:biopolymer transport protein ExbD
MSAPNVIPMADIMLVLLIIFMVVTPMLTKGKDVNMANVPHPEDLPNADRDDAIIVAVTRDGVIYLGNDKTTEEDFTTKVKDLVSNRSDKTVFIRADGRAHYGDVTKVVDDIRSAGVDKVGLLTERVTRAEGTTPLAPGAPTPGTPNQ